MIYNIVMYFYIYIASFLFSAFIYSILASFTKKLYIHKSVIDLSSSERDILYNRASFSTKIGVFFINFLGCFISPFILIIAIIPAIIISLIWLF